jgi:hypothetical protein
VRPPCLEGSVSCLAARIRIPYRLTRTECSGSAIPFGRPHQNRSSLCKLFLSALYTNTSRSFNFYFLSLTRNTTSISRVLGHGDRHGDSIQCPPLHTKSAARTARGNPAQHRSVLVQGLFDIPTPRVLQPDIFLESMREVTCSNATCGKKQWITAAASKCYCSHCGLFNDWNATAAPTHLLRTVKNTDPQKDLLSLALTCKKFSGEGLFVERIYPDGLSHG